MSLVLLYTLAFVPILLFVVVVILMDAFSLTKWKRLVFCILSGALCLLLTLLIGNMIHSAFRLYLMAIIAELLKGIPLLYLVQKRKIVMLGDATIYGSAVGAGYALKKRKSNIKKHKS